MGLGLVQGEFRAAEAARENELAENLKFKDTLTTDPPTDEQIAAQRLPALVLNEKLAAEFPALRVTARPVPEEQNAYLLLHQLAGPGHPAINRLPMSEEFKKSLCSRDRSPLPISGRTRSADIETSRSHANSHRHRAQHPRSREPKTFRVRFHQTSPIGTFWLRGPEGHASGAAMVSGAA